jgi:hypothetical protein
MEAAILAAMHKADLRIGHISDRGPRHEGREPALSLRLRSSPRLVTTPTSVGKKMPRVTVPNSSH